jgi:hypothetical protein
MSAYLLGITVYIQTCCRWDVGQDTRYSASSVNVDIRLQSIQQGSGRFFTSLSGAKTR